MKYSYYYFAALPVVLASPVPEAGQKLATSACSSAHSGTFGIVIIWLTIFHVETIGAKVKPRQVLSQIPDGQIQAPWGTSHPVWTITPSTSPSVSSTSQPASSSSKQMSSSKESSSSLTMKPPVSQINDGQIQNPVSTSSQKPATSTAASSSKTSTKSTTPAASSSQSSFKPATSAASSGKTLSKPVTTSSAASSSKSTSLTMMPPVSQIHDGQIQNPVTSSPPKSTSSSSKDNSMTASTKKSSTSSSKKSSTPATCKQCSTSSSSKIPSKTSSPSTSCTTLTMMPPISQINDGQIQNPIPQPSKEVTKSTTIIETTTTTAKITITKSASTSKQSSSSTRPASTKTSGTVVSQLVDGQIQVPSGMPQSWNNIGACKGKGALTLTLSDGILKDGRGWQGYIAANRQLQFDSPPQAGAVITSGFSVCANGSLALNGKSVFYECLSGDFYNLYDESIAPYCKAVTLSVAELVKC